MQHLITLQCMSLPQVSDPGNGLAADVLGGANDEADDPPGPSPSQALGRISPSAVTDLFVSSQEDEDVVASSQEEREEHNAASVSDDSDIDMDDYLLHCTKARHSENKLCKLSFSVLAA